MSTERNCTQDWGSCKTSRIWCSEEKLQGSSLQLYNNWLCGYFSWSLDFLISTKALNRSFCAILKLSFIVWPVEAWESKSREEGKAQCCYRGNKKSWTANNLSKLLVPNIYYVFFIQILQVAPSLHMVEVRKAKGDTLEFQKVTTMHAKIMPIKETHVFMYWRRYWNS